MFDNVFRLVVLTGYILVVCRALWMLHVGETKVPGAQRWAVRIIGLMATAWAMFYGYLVVAFWDVAPMTTGVGLAGTWSRAGHVATFVGLMLLLYLIKNSRVYCENHFALMASLERIAAEEEARHDAP